MYFDFEDRRFETSGLDSVLSYREQVLMSLVVHLLVVVVVFLLPTFSFVQSAAEAREKRLAELSALQEITPLASVDDDRTFVFIEPRVYIEAQEPPRVAAPLSDRDRVSQSPTEAETPLNTLPNAVGNSTDFVESDDPSDGDLSGLVAEENQADLSEPSEPLTEDLADTDAVRDADITEASRSPEDEGPLSPEEIIERAIADGSLTFPGDGRDDPDAVNADAERPADGLLGRAMQNLERYVQRENFANERGSTGRFGPWIQFDSKGIEFGPWIRRFVAQIRRNWFVPYAIMSRSMHGNVMLTFYVHRDGAISELTIAKPAEIDAFTNSAFNALSTSNPTQPLPPEYPDDRAFFTVIFYFNESPPV